MNDLYLYNLIFIFFAFSVLGWIIEVTLKYLQYGRFINRGFLIGPYCPIYGSGAVVVTVVSDIFSKYDSSFGTSFFISFFLCGILEYITSFILEKRFHARWWDYSQKPMNLHGRVWIGNLLLFGFGGMLIYKVFDPYIINFMSYFTYSSIKVISLVIVIVMSSDYVLSHFIIKLLKEGVENSQADDSEVIAKEVRFLLENKSILHKRIIDAYPEITFRTEKVKQRLEKIKRDTERLRELTNDKIFEISDFLEETEEDIAKNLITTRNLQKSIIEIQDEIIKELLKDDIQRKEKIELFDTLEEKKQILYEREQRLLPRLIDNIDKKQKH